MSDICDNEWLITNSLFHFIVSPLENSLEIVGKNLENEGIFAYFIIPLNLRIQFMLYIFHILTYYINHINFKKGWKV